MKLYELTIHELRDMLKNKETTVVDITKSYIERIKEVNPKLNCYITVCEEEALKQAEEIQKKYDNGEDTGWLCGIPIALKDIFCTDGIKTTCASRMLENFVPPYDATAVKKLKENNAILIGKTNMDEFAMGASNEHSYFSPARNPWNTEYVPGGSSGGSAAAVSANLTAGALGTDTGGSIREPSSFCSCVGLKPTYGLVSRYGVVAFASSLDHIGPITKDVEDAAIMLNAIAGHDELDSTSVDMPKKDYTQALKNDIKGLKIGVPKEYFGSAINPEVAETVRNAINKCKELGAEIEEFSLEVTNFIVPTYYITCCAEASSNLGRFDGVRYGYRTKNYSTLEELYTKSRSEGFGEEVKRRIMLGTYVLSSGYYDAYYKKALEVRTLVKQGYADAFKKYDVIMAPVVPMTPFKIGERISDPVEMYLIDICTASANIAGLPAMSIPCGFDSKGLPIGLQIIGKPLDEEKILQVAYTYEQNTEWHKKKPNI